MGKVGIMSMQRIKNYGSFLQAYSLKKTIESLGHEVEFIDYEYEKSLVKGKKEILKKIKKNINIIHYIKKRNNYKKFREKFDNEFLPEIGIDKINYNKNVQTLVVGSDEVFNCLQPYPVGYSRNLFGMGYKNSNVISYAACFGFTNLEGLKEHKIDKEVAELLNDFKAVSVRDKNSYNTVKSLTNKEPIINLDPVLIYNFSDYIKDVELKNYIIIYAYPGRLSKKEENYIKKFAKKHNKKILSLGSYQRIADIVKIIHPLDVFSYFKNADYIITDTFHGTIFSVKTHAKFCSIIRKSNNNKLYDLLERLNQTDRIASSVTDIERLYNTDPIYEKTDKIIEKERNKSLDYLEKNLV